MAEGDRVLLNGRRLSSPLRKDESSPVPNGNGNIEHNDIIGKTLSTLRIDGRDGRYVAVQYPTLEQYVSLTRRNVTPIYASYANSIVSLLDLHGVSPVTSADEEGSANRLEILEAGTGHGSLTMQLGRAIAAGNPPQPGSLLPRRGSSSKRYADLQSEDLESKSDMEWSQWFRTRRSVVHTVEKVTKNSRDAEKFIRGFRQGMYWPHIDFYAEEVDKWIESQLAVRDAHESGFLSHVVLDMPGVEQMVPRAAAAMREDAKLVVFCPSITQIAECQRLIHKENVPLVFDKAVELGEGISTGRLWDVRVVIPRQTLAAKERTVDESSDGSGSSGSDESDTSDQEAAAEERRPAPTDETKFVCRPKVGEMTFGGGFLGLWRKSTFKKQ